jgi:hypothetical protein
MSDQPFNILQAMAGLKKECIWSKKNFQRLGRSFTISPCGHGKIGLLKIEKTVPITTK